MRTIVFALVSAAVFALLIGLNLQKEAILAGGRTVFLKQAPLDPRSIIQGDYMQVRYRIEESVRRDPAWETTSGGYLVLTADERGVARFVRIHAGEPLTDGEFRLRFRRRKHRLRIGAEAFFFQEGHGKRYQDSQYGELKVSPEGDCILVALVGEDLEPLGDR